MVMPGATTRKPRENVLLLGWRAALTVCHAMIIAMTVVLPAPVASFSARRSGSGFASALAFRMCSELAIAGAHLRRDFDEPDRRFDRLDLTEERSHALEAVAAPMLQQSGCLRR